LHHLDHHPIEKFAFRISCFDFPVSLVPLRQPDSFAPYAAAWSRCTRRASHGLFCREHRDALDGAFMGILHANKPLYASHAETEHPGLLAAADAETALKDALAFLVVVAAAREDRRIRAQEKGGEEAAQVCLRPQAGAHR
jgi:hypothetical protein